MSKEKCCIHWCKFSGESANLFMFPTSPSRRKKWLNITGIPSPSESPQRPLFICSQHFRPSQLSHIPAVYGKLCLRHNEDPVKELCASPSGEVAVFSTAHTIQDTKLISDKSTTLPTTVEAGTCSEMVKILLKSKIAKTKATEKTSPLLPRPQHQDKLYGEHSESAGCPTSKCSHGGGSEDSVDDETCDQLCLIKDEVYTDIDTSNLVNTEHSYGFTLKHHRGRGQIPKSSSTNDNQQFKGYTFPTDHRDILDKDTHPGTTREADVENIRPTNSSNGSSNHPPAENNSDSSKSFTHRFRVEKTLTGSVHRKTGPTIFCGCGLWLNDFNLIGDKSVHERCYTCQQCGQRHVVRTEVTQSLTSTEVYNVTTKTSSSSRDVEVVKLVPNNDEVRIRSPLQDVNKNAQEVMSVGAKDAVQKEEMSSFDEQEIVVSDNNNMEMVSYDKCLQVDRDEENERPISRNTNSEKMFSCKFCTKDFYTEKKRKRHEDHYHGGHGEEICQYGKFTSPLCHICGEQFKTILFLKRHLFLHANPNAYQCTVCKLVLSHPSSLKQHMTIHYPDVTNLSKHVCHHCGATMRNVTKLKLHLAVKHNEPYVFQCRSCNVKFESYSEYNKHLKSHRENGKYLCGVCGCRFMQQRDLNIHKTRMHRQSSPGQQQCNKSEKHFKCDQCEKSFKLKTEMILHKERVHLGINRYKCSCSICGKTFCNKSLLAFHENVHNDVKPYECEICHKRFPRPVTKEHLKTHSNERPFKCSVCLLSFKRKSAMEVHQQKVHSSERPFPCHMCSVSFKYKADRTRHINIFHQNTEEKCKMEIVMQLPANAYSFLPFK